jgi:preprotein translocase subunit SecG
MSTLITVLHVIVCLFLMLTVLLQSGKGGGMGGAFGGGNAATVFGGSGASSFLKRLTAIAGTIFMITSMVLAFLSSASGDDALSRFGREQEEMATQKERLKLDAIKARRQQPQPQGGASSMGSPGSITAPVAEQPLTPAEGSAAPAEPAAVEPTEPTPEGSDGNAGSAAPADSSPNAPKP